MATIGPINLEVSELDFELIKEDLKNYLRSQNEFIDYDFEGAGLSVLVDLLSYNTHYNAFYANMLVNESFLDSAVRRNNVVSHAKHIGYTPRSVSAARAVIDITISTTDVLEEIVIPRGTQFTTEIDDVTYTFVTIETTVAPSVGNNNYVAEGVEIVEGTFVTFSYTVDEQDPDQRFIIPNNGADTSTLSVAVQENINSTVLEFYSLIEDINLVDGDDLIYFLQEIEDEQFQVYFGDGILGKPVCDGNVILIEYIVSNGEAANAAAIFTPAEDISGYPNVTVTTGLVASGGAPREDIESIRRNAPLFYQAQNRVVTAEDYRTLLARNSTIVQNADSIAVWGGEDNVPPQYGLVYISLKPKLGDTITSALKNIIEEEIVKDFNVVTITPRIIDPDFLFLELDTSFVYDSAATSLSASALQDLVRTEITNFNDNTLEFFDRTFRYSTFVCMVDEVERAIQSNLTTLRIKKKFTPRFGINTQYDVRFENPLEAGTLQSSGFIVNEPTQTETDVYFFRDDGAGNLVLFKQLTDFSTVVIDANFGTIDYDTGVIDITCFAPVALVDSTEISISFEPRENDIFSVRNLILTIEDEDVVVSGSPITTT